MEKDNKSFTISEWHKGRANNCTDDDYDQTNGMKCGESGHYFKNCPHETKVCFQCNSSQHTKKTVQTMMGPRKIRVPSYFLVQRVLWVTGIPDFPLP